ncbi:MAG: recombinase family protein [Planctomycetes bacterium]|nr:recombinase family protein [Planctomycetota bacterium]
MIRAAIYTRSAIATDHDQRERAEDYIAKMGWHCILNRYDDNGYSGIKYDRPALQRLLHDVENGRIDYVVVHDIARLSRSSSDLQRILDTFDRNGVSVRRTEQ